MTSKAASALVLACVIVGLPGCASLPAPITGKTVAGDRLQADTANDVVLLAKSIAQCTSVDAIQVEPISTPANLSDSQRPLAVGESVKERWIAKLCGRSVPLVVTFTGTTTGTQTAVKSE